MADLIGTASIRVDMGTAGAAGKIRRFANQAEGSFQRLQRRVTQVQAQMQRLGPVAMPVTVMDNTARGTAAIRARVRDLKNLGPVTIAANVDDQTASGASSATATAQALKALGPIRIPVTLADDTPAGNAAITATLARMQSLGPVRIPVSVNDGTRRGARTVQATVASLQRLGPIQINATVDVDVAATTAAAAALRDLQAAARAAARALGILATRATAAAAALVALGAAARTLRGDMDDLDGSIRRAGGGMAGLRGRLGSVTTTASSAGEALDGLKSAALLLAPALIPIAVQALPIAASLGAATVAIGAFAAAAAGQISQLSEASEAEKKYQDAVSEHGRASKQATDAGATYARIIERMPPATRQAAASVSALKTEFADWSNGLAKFTMVPVTKGLDLTRMLLPKLSPLVRGTSQEFSHFLDVVAGASQSSGFDRFTGAFAEFAESSLAKATNGLVKFSQAADMGEIGGNLRAFLAYARENGPLVGDTLRQVAEAVARLAVGFSDVGVSALTVINAFAGMVNAIPPSWVSTMVQAYAALKLVRLGIAGVTAVASAGAVAQLTAFSRAARFGGVGSAIQGVAQRMSGLQKAALGLGVLAVAAVGVNELAKRARGAPPDVDKLTTSLKNLAVAGKFTGELKNTFGSVDGLVAKMKRLQVESDKTKKASEGAFGFRIPLLDDAADAIASSINDISKGGDSFNALKDDFSSLDKAFAQAASGGNANAAAEAFRMVKAAAKEQGISVSELNKQFPEYRAAVASVKAEQDLAAKGMGVFGQQAQATSTKLEGQRAAADGLRQAITALNEVNQSAYGAQIQFEGAIDSLTGAFKENGSTLNINTEAGRKNGEAMLAAAKSRDELIASGLAAGDSLSSMTGKSDKLRETMVRLATEAFDGNKKKAQEYTNTLLGTPSEVKTLVKAERAEAITGLQAVQAEIRKTPKAKSITVSTLNAAAIKALEAVGYKTKTLKDGRTKVTTANGQAIGSIGAVGRALSNLDGRTARTYTFHSVRTTYISDIVRGKGSLHDAVGATGGLYTGKDFKYRGYADGGLVNGPGTETSDSVYAPFLSKNEFVVNARRTREHLPLLKAINSGQMGMAGGGMAGAGAAVGAGLVSGLNGATRAVEDAARTLADAVTSGVRDELQIASPSKVMKALAKDVGAGFLKGLTDSRDKIKSVSKDLASDVRAAFSGRRETSLIKMIGRNTDRLLSQATKRDAVAKKIADAKAFSSDVAGKARATGSLGSIVEDDFFAPSYVEKRMKAALASVKTFSANVSKLQKKGLSKALLRQVLDMGPEAGGAFAKSLAGADAATIKRYNKLQSDLDKQSKSLGNKGADMLYDSGKKAGAGFLTGLKAQQKSIEKLMLSIAKGMQKAIRRALGIKSPSTVFAAIGRNIGDGLISGLTQSNPKVTAAVTKMASAASSVSPKAAGAARKAQGQRPASGYLAAVGELDRLVDSGKWRKKGSQLFEDISFQGMSKNFQTQQMKVADGFWAAVADIKKAVRAGKSVFEDMTFKGMSGNVSRFHDVIAQVWKGNPYGRNFGDWGNFGSYGRYGKYAGGGVIRGPGTGTSDSVPIMASRDEFMMRTAAVDYYGLPAMAALNSMRIPRRALATPGAPRTEAREPAGSGGDLHVHVHNDGVIGSQMELDNWLAKSLDRLNQQRRLPAPARGGR